MVQCALDPLGFFCGSVLGQDMNNVSCLHDMTEILLKTV